MSLIYFRVALSTGLLVSLLKSLSPYRRNLLFSLGSRRRKFLFSKIIVLRRLNLNSIKHAIKKKVLKIFRRIASGADI